MENGTKDQRRASASLLRMVARGIHETTWWQHGCAVDARGVPCQAGDGRAACWDTRGHLMRALMAGDTATGEGPRMTARGLAELERLEAALLETVNERGDCEWRSVHEWNDQPNMCAWKVRKALRATARKLEGRSSDSCRVCGAWARVGSHGWCSSCLEDHDAERAEDGPSVEW